MSRPKKPKIELASIDDCTRVMGELLIDQLQLEALVAGRDLAVAKASATYEGAIDKARGSVASAIAALEAYYYGHLAEIEVGGVKHLKLANGVIGRRDHPPALRPLNRAWKWAAIINAVRAKFGGKYFRDAEPELDKDALKAAKLAVEELKQLGLKLAAEETFYAEPARLAEVEA